MKPILVINPGSTSTKLALFESGELLQEKNVFHGHEEFAHLHSIWEQVPIRRAHLESFLTSCAEVREGLAAVSARGGLLKPLDSGTYPVNEAMLADLKAAERGEHASNLGAPLAQQLAQQYQVPAFIVDPVSVDEMDEVARMCGHPDLRRSSLSHALNMKACAKRYARQIHKVYEDLKLIVAHLGSGASLSAHVRGRMVDVINPREEGPMSMERTGSMPLLPFIEYCMNRDMTFKQVEALVFKEGGIFAHLGTKDLKVVEQRMHDGDEAAAAVFHATAYQVAKSITSLMPAVGSQPDAMIITGGMAHSDELVQTIAKRIRTLGDIVIFPGEGELLALCEGAERVLTGQEEPRTYR